MGAMPHPPPPFHPSMLRVKLFTISALIYGSLSESLLEQTLKVSIYYDNSEQV